MTKPTTISKTVVGIVTALSIGSCTGETDAYKAAHAAGWQGATVTGSNYLGSFVGCGSDEVAYYIKGANPSGRPAEATVCCGYFLKGCTIRY